MDRRRRLSAAVAAVTVAAFSGCGGDDSAPAPQPTRHDPAGDVYDRRVRRVTSAQPQLDFRTAGMRVDDGVLRLALTTEQPPRSGTFTLAAPFADCEVGGLIVEIRVEPGREAAVRATDLAHPHLRQVPGARATVAGSRLTATVPLRAKAELGRDWLVWSGTSDNDFADSVPDWKGIDGVSFSRGGTPDYGSDCAHPKIRLIR